MFIHEGQKRTARHNLQLASLLSFTAGIVNVAGFLAVARLTTNVTGHFAFFVDEVFRLNFMQGFIYFLYILSFFLGSFFANFIIEFGSLKKAGYVYLIPVGIESLILVIVAAFGKALINEPDLLACSLLFAMGLQNSMVTRISNAAVRTTHLTGLFTDLGIEVSQLLFHRETESRQKLLSSVKLRLTIIGFFFTGGIFGAVIYSKAELHVLFFAAIALIMGMIYDQLRLKRDQV